MSNKGDIDGLRKFYEERECTIEKNLSDLVEMGTGFEKMINLLDFLPSKVEHKIMIPVCGSRSVMVPGRIVSTNEIMMQLDDCHFVKKTTTQASKITQQRLHMCETMQKDFKTELAQLQEKMSVMEKIGLQDDFEEVSTKRVRDIKKTQGDMKETRRDIKETRRDIKETRGDGAKKTDAEEDLHPTGQIRTTREGFVEIIEREPEPIASRQIAPKKKHSKFDDL